MPKNRFWSQNLKNLSPDLESALPRYHVYQFSVKTDNFDFFDPNLSKKENYDLKFSKLIWNKNQHP